MKQDLHPSSAKETLAEYDYDNPRKLVVEMRGNGLPSYTFEGPWTGKDIIILRSTVRRAYYLRQRGLRRELEASEQPLSSEEKGE